MAGLNVALASGKSAMITKQRELAVVSNNMANANKAGYHRQVATVQSNIAMSMGSTGMVGTGVHVEEITRRYDMALETSLKQAQSEEGYATVYADELSRFEQVIAPGGESIVQQSINDFADSWQDLSNQPESDQARTQIIERGKILADNINITRNQLISLRDAIADSTGNGNLSSRVDQLNSYATEITQLNTTISDIESRIFRPLHANDLRDRRDYLVSEMKKIADISVSEDANKMYNITIDGTNFVTGTVVDDTITVTMPPTGPTLTWNSAATNITLTSGEAKGFTDAYAYIQNIIDDIDAFSNTITTELNTVHVSGFDPSGVAGGNLFSFVGNTLSFIEANPQRIAASNSNTLSGDGENARDIWTAINTGYAAINNNSIMDRFDYIIDEVSINAANSEAIAVGAQAGVVMFENAISMVSGVNIDEEMMSMLDLQRGYQAAAKFINVVDEMMSTIISLKR